MKISKSDKQDLLDAFRTGLVATFEKNTVVDTRKTAGDPNVNVTGENLSITKYIKGMSGGGWANADAEQAIFKALGQDNSTEGGVFVPTQLSGDVIELLKEVATIRSMPGVRVIDLTGDKLSMNRITDAPVISWGAENTEISEDTTLKFGDETLELKKAVCLYKMSRELLDNANTSVDAIVRSELADALALEEDKVFLEGTGGTKPLGLYFNPRVVSTTISTSPTFDTFKDAIYNVRLNKAEITGWVGHPRSAHTLSKLKDGNGRYILDLSGPGVAGTGIGMMQGLPFKQTTQVPITNRSAANDSYVVGGRWSDYIIGQKPGLRIETSTDRYFEYDQIALRLVNFVGSMLRHTGAFVVIKGIQA